MRLFLHEKTEMMMIKYILTLVKDKIGKNHFYSREFF